MLKAPKVGIGAKLMAQNPGKRPLMGDDPRLPKMPERPGLVDFFEDRFTLAQLRRDPIDLRGDPGGLTRRPTLPSEGVMSDVFGTA